MRLPSYDISEYHDYITAARKSNSMHRQTLFWIAIAFFGAGLVSIYFGAYIPVVVLLGFSIFFFQATSHYSLMEDVLIEHWHLALLINRGHTELEALRARIEGEEDAKITVE